MGNWTDERIAELKKLWDDGRSCSQIAHKLGGITRNAVIGKVNRLKLEQRHDGNGHPSDQPSTRAKHRAQMGRGDVGGGLRQRIHRKLAEAPPIMPPEPTPTPPPALVDEIPAIPGLTLLELTNETCRWPTNDGDPYYFCGSLPVPGRPYCADHCAKAYGKWAHP